MGNKLRTAITVAIIAFGIMALVGIITAIEAMNNSLRDSFSTMGANAFSIRFRERRFNFGGDGGSDVTQSKTNKPKKIRKSIRKTRRSKLIKSRTNKKYDGMENEHAGEPSIEDEKARILEIMNITNTYFKITMRNITDIIFDVLSNLKKLLIIDFLDNEHEDDITRVVLDYLEVSGDNDSIKFALDKINFSIFYNDKEYRMPIESTIYKLLDSGGIHVIREKLPDEIIPGGDEEEEEL